MEEDKEKVSNIVRETVRLMLTETQPTRKNDVLQYDPYGEIVLKWKFYNYEGNVNLRNILQTEGYLEEYQNAYRGNDENRINKIIQIGQKVLERVQKLLPPMR